MKVGIEMEMRDELSRKGSTRRGWVTPGYRPMVLTVEPLSVDRHTCKTDMEGLGRSST
jgi:hypothetical protein